MAASDITVARPALDAVDWEGLAALMGIPDGRREHFGSALLDIKNATKLPQKPLVWDDTDIASAGRAFIRALKQRGPLSTPTERGILKIVGEYLDEHARPPKRGAPKRANKFAFFPEDLFHLVYMFGGHVTVNQKTKGGNVVDLLDELRPVMPELIPQELPMPLIERLATQTRARLRTGGPIHLRCGYVIYPQVDSPPNVGPGTGCPQ
jgi:hypothetical protein